MKVNRFGAIEAEAYGMKLNFRYNFQSNAIAVVGAQEDVSTDVWTKKSESPCLLNLFIFFAPLTSFKTGISDREDLVN